LDDLFYASDYINKNTFAEFLQKVVELFETHIPELPLQFIIFTHDDVIFESAIDAVETHAYKLETSTEIKNGKRLIEKTIIGRFYNPDDKEDSLSYYNMNNPFWNLIYELPQNKTKSA
jgi:hypothetical protein